MKILSIVTDYPENQSDFRFQFIHEPLVKLVERGHDVDVIIAKPFFKWPLYKLKNIDFERKVDCVNIYTIFYLKFPGFKFYIFDSKQLLQAILRFLKPKKDFEYEIINGHGLPTISAINGISDLYSIPSVLTIHGIEDPTKIQDTKHKESFLKTNLGLLNHIILVGKSLIPYIQNFSIGSEKFSVIGNGVNYDYFNSSPRSDSSSQEFRILSISNLHEIKGLDTNIYAIKDLVELGYNQVRYRIGGRGYDEKRLRRLVNTLGLNQYIEFLGYIERDKVPIIMKSSSLFSLPSRLEAFGIVYLEAMASGLPVIGTEDQGASDIIEQRHNGFLIKQDDYKAITTIVLELLSDETLKERIIRNAKETVRKQFSWDRNAKLIEELFIDLIK